LLLKSLFVHKNKKLKTKNKVINKYSNKNNFFFKQFKTIKK